MSRIKYSNLPFWLFTLATVFALTLPILVQDGMFQDGVLYSAVAHNLSLGYGSFWFPQYSALNIEGLPSFHEQPPLAFGIESLFFKILGDSLYVERFYTLLTMLLTVWILVKIWRLATIDAPANWQHLTWLPVLFWIIVPVCFWSYRNNMHENTLTIFALLAFLSFYSGWIPIQKSSRFLSLNPYVAAVISGFFIFGATLVKGFPGFFILAVPGCYWLFTKRISFKKMALQTIVALAVPLAIYTVLFLWPVSKKSLSYYLFDRALLRMGAVPTADYHLEIWVQLLQQLVLPFTLLVLIFLLAWRAKWRFTQPTPLVWRQSLFFMAVGAAGTLPLALTLVQKWFYMVPAFPFWAVGMALVAASPTSDFVNWLKTKKRAFAFVLTFNALLLAGVLIYSAAQIGKTYREHATLNDVYKIGKLVPSFTNIAVPSCQYNQYNFILQGFLVRFFNISVVPENHKLATTTPFWLSQCDALCQHIPPDGYEVILEDGQKYALCKRVENQP